MTIAKIMQNHSLRATFSYAVSKSGARIIGGNVAPWIEQNQLSDSQLKSLIDVTVKQFMMSADLNPDIKRPVYHLSIALPPHENLNDQELSDFCESFTAALLLTAQRPELLKEFDTTAFRAAVEQFQREELPKYQYSIVRHVDADHTHAHIVASKINLESEQAVSTSYDYYRAQKILRDLEQQYGLSVLENSWEVGRKAETRRQIQVELDTGKPSVQKQLQDALERSIAVSQTVPELISNLLAEGIGARVEFTRTGKPKGISYILNDVPMAGNQLGNRYSFPGLQRNSGLSYEAERDNDRIQALCQQKPLTPEQPQPAPETHLAETLDDLIEAILAEYNIDQPDVATASSSNLDALIEEVMSGEEFEQWEPSVTDLLQSTDVPVWDSDDHTSVAQFLPDDADPAQAVDRQLDAANTIAAIAARLFEHYVETGEQAYKVSPDSTEWIYRVEVSNRTYLISRDDLTDTYNVHCEGSDMNLQMCTGVTNRDLEIWQDLNRWLTAHSVADAPSQPFEPEHDEDTNETSEDTEFWEVSDLEPQESESSRQQRFAQTIAAEIRWLAQIGNINGTHYTLSQSNGYISLARKNGQVIGQFPLDATELSQGLALTESDVERFQVIQQERWAIAISETILTIWQKAGEPQAVLGKQYDAFHADGLLYLHRKDDSSPILEIPADWAESPRGQQLTQNDFEYFEQAKVLLRQNEIDYERDR